MGCGVYYWVVTYWRHGFDWLIMAIKTFTDGVSLPASDINTYLANSGLVYVTSQTVGTGVSSVTVSNAFNSSYDNYRVIWTGGTFGVNDNAISVQFANTAHHYACMRYDSFTGTGSGTLFTNAQTSAYTGLSATATQTSIVMDVMTPYLAQFTKWTNMLTSNLYVGYAGGVYAQNTSISSITFIQGGGFTGGTITVFGYRKA